MGGLGGGGWVAGSRARAGNAGREGGVGSGFAMYGMGGGSGIIEGLKHHWSASALA